MHFDIPCCLKVFLILKIRKKVSCVLTFDLCVFLKQTCLATGSAVPKTLFSTTVRTRIYQFLANKVEQFTSNYNRIFTCSYYVYK